VPVRKDKEGNIALEYEKNTAEENGLVKIDFLGLKTLDIIDQTNEIIKAAGKEVPNIDLEGYDKETYDLISRGDTFGVFQFGTSATTIDLCKRIKPTNMSDLATITTLARPASKEIRYDFIDTRDGKKEIKLLHPSLKNAFKDTFGFPLYDESLLTLAKDVAGWDLGEADKLRKLTKEKGKNPQKVKKWKEEFIEGSVKNGLTEHEGEEIWEKVVCPYSRYSFNLSHAVLYSMVSYKTAYLKAHYPVEFLLANLMNEVNSNAKDAKTNKAKFKNELRANNIKIVAPDINKSQLTYTIQDGDKLLTGLDALKSVGDDAIKDVLEKRPFTSFFDFMSRVNSSKVRANTIQTFAATGCLDSFGLPRKLMYLYCSDYRKKLQVWCKKHDPSKEEFIYPWTNEQEWSLSELYALEQHLIGDSFICKPYEAHGNFFKHPHITIGQILKCEDKIKIDSCRAIVKEMFEFKVKKETSKYYGQSMIKAIIEDRFGEQCGCTIFPDRLEKAKERIKMISSKSIFEPGLAIHFCGQVNKYDDNIGIILDSIYDISKIPVLPADLKAKKVSLKKNKEEPVEEIKNKDLSEELEDDLYDNGLIDLEEENDF
jgi:DNA polymerase-3 subunit alpha